MSLVILTRNRWIANGSLPIIAQRPHKCIIHFYTSLNIDRLMFIRIRRCWSMDIFSLPNWSTFNSVYSLYLPFSLFIYSKEVAKQALTIFNIFLHFLNDRKMVVLCWREKIHTNICFINQQYHNFWSSWPVDTKNFLRMEHLWYTFQVMVVFQRNHNQKTQGKYLLKDKMENSITPADRL